MQQRIRSLIARQYYKNKYGPQTIDDDNLLDVRVGDDNTIQTRQGNVITINSDDEDPKPKPIQQEIVVKKQEYLPSKLEERINPSQTSLQQQLQQSTIPQIDHTLSSMAQLQKSLAQIKIQPQTSQQPSLNRVQPSQQQITQQSTQPIQTLKQIQQPPPQVQKQSIHSNRIQTKMNIESDDEEIYHRNPQKKFIRTNDDESLPQINYKKKTDVFAQLKQRITQRLDDKTALQISCTIRPREEDSPEPEPSNDFAPVSYQDYIAMKNREINAAKQRKQDEEYRQQLLQQKKQEKVAPEKIREGETLQQYQQRMIQYLQRKNKYKNTSKVKKGTDLEFQKTAEEKQKINELMKIIDPTFPQDEEFEKPIKPDLLNYDVLLKNGLILKQAFFKPPEPEINPMIHVYKKGRYATEFIFSGGIDLDDGPYGQQSKRKPKKLPFPKHRLSLSPWEYYGVGPEEYFATRNPNFEFKQKYVPVKDYYNEMPRPKQNPKYFHYDVDQLLAKRYHQLHQEIQYQTSFIGYKQRHWTPLAHLKAVCATVVMEYEKYERDRLFCYVVCAKVSKYQLVDTVGILTSRFTKNRIENLVMTFWKGDSKGEKKTISNLEKQVPDDQLKQTEEMMLFNDEEDENERKKKVSKEQLHLEDEWDPTKDEATERGRRNKLRKEKFQKIAQEIQFQQSQKKEKVKKNNVEEESEKQGKIKNENEQTENEQTKKEKKRQKKERKRGQKEAAQQQTQIEANQFEEQFKYEQYNEIKQKESDEEVFQDNEDLIFRNKLIELNQKRSQLVGNLDVDIQESKKLFFGQQNQKLDEEKYKIFMPK